jgi:formate dehydrogenase major subunit
MTDRPGVFSGGDCQMGTVTVIQSVAQGKLAAKAIDRYLAGDDMSIVAEEIQEEERVPELIDIVPYKPEEPQVRMPFLPFKDRELSFERRLAASRRRRRPRDAYSAVYPDVGRCHLQRHSMEHGLTYNPASAPSRATTTTESTTSRNCEYDLTQSLILRDLTNASHGQGGTRRRARLAHHPPTRPLDVGPPARRRAGASDPGLGQAP